MENSQKIPNLNLDCITIASLIYQELKKWKKESPLRVQKILWYVQICYFVEYGKLLFVDQFESWNYGPVLPKVWANCPYIQEFKLSNVDDNLKQKIESVIKYVVKKKANLFFFTLVDETHKQEPYKKTITNPKNQIITNELLVQYAKDIDNKYLK